MRGWEGCMSWRVGRMLWNAAFREQCALCAHESRAGNCIRPAWNKPYKRESASWDKELLVIDAKTSRIKVIDACWEKGNYFSSWVWLLVDCPCSGGWPHNHAVLYLVGYRGWGEGGSEEGDMEAEERNTWSMAKGSGEGSLTWIWWRDMYTCTKVSKNQ